MKINDISSFYYTKLHDYIINSVAICFHFVHFLFKNAKTRLKV